MPDIALRPKARADLDSIWDYTVASWGRDQAKTYLREHGRLSLRGLKHEFELDDEVLDELM